MIFVNLSLLRCPFSNTFDFSLETIKYFCLLNAERPQEDEVRKEHHNVPHHSMDIAEKRAVGERKEHHSVPQHSMDIAEKRAVGERKEHHNVTQHSMDIAEKRAVQCATLLYGHS